MVEVGRFAHPDLFGAEEEGWFELEDVVVGDAGGVGEGDGALGEGFFDFCEFAGALAESGEGGCCGGEDVVVDGREGEGGGRLQADGARRLIVDACS